MSTHKKKYHSRFRGSQVMEVVRTVICEGDGTEENVAREVTYYSDVDGNLLAKVDPIEELENEFNRGRLDGIDEHKKAE